MSFEHIRNEELIDCGFEPRNLRELGPQQMHTCRRLFQAHMLTGEPEECFNDVCTYADVRDKKKFVQALAAADIVRLEHFLHGTGRETCSKLIGWARARIEKTFHDEPPYADVEAMHVDVTVLRAPVESFLVQCLKDHTRTRKKKIAGLKVSVPHDATETTAFYMRHGFRESPRNDDVLLWHPE